MSNFIPFNRDQLFLPTSDLREWLPADDIAHFIVAAVDRVPPSLFVVRDRSDQTRDNIDPALLVRGNGRRGPPGIASRAISANFKSASFNWWGQFEPAAAFRQDRPRC